MSNSLFHISAVTVLNGANTLHIAALFTRISIFSNFSSMEEVKTAVIEKALNLYNEFTKQELEKKIRENSFTLTDFREQMKQIQSMGSMSDLLKMIPGVDAKALSGVKIDEKALPRIDAIISSMTEFEREHPSEINFSRKKRIAAGSGVTVEEVNRLLKQFEASRKMMKQMPGMMGKGAKRGRFNLPF